MNNHIIDETTFWQSVKELIFLVFCYYEFKFLIKFFVRKKSKNLKNYIEHACDLEKISIVEILIKKGAKDLDECFNNMIFRKNLEIAKMLLPKINDVKKSLAIAKNFKIREIEIMLEFYLKKDILEFAKINHLKEGF